MKRCELTGFKIRSGIRRVGNAVAPLQRVMRGFHDLVTSLFFHKLILNGCAAYYRGAMGILLVYDVTDERGFNSTPQRIRNKRFVS